MGNIAKRLRTERSVYDAELCDEAADEIERLRAALAIPKWKSCHKDNMEFSATISCYTMDKIRQALAEVDDE
jgi:hypothetical protein